MRRIATAGFVWEDDHAGTSMQRELRRQFELADANWQAWTPR